MKKLLLIYVGIFCSVLALGQTNFQKLTLDEACTKAKAEKKLIFVDLYTSWCAPCKMMADKVFPDVKLGAFMNERFVCVKYDTGADKDGSELAKKFNVQAYPTFLILNVDKGLENQIVGATLEPLDFMNQVEVALKASLASLGQQYANGNRDVSFLTDYLKQRYRIRSISSKYRLIQVYADPDDGAIQIMPRQVVLNQHSANLLVFPVNIVRPLHGDMIRI